MWTCDRFRSISICAAVLVLVSVSASTQVVCEFPSELRTYEYLPVRATGLAPTFKSSISFEPGDKSVIRRILERADSTSEWQVLETEASASFVITAVASRDGGDVLYVAGYDPRTCEDVIEEWTWRRRPGAVQIQATASTRTTPPVPSVGTPAPPFGMQTGLTEGETFISVDERPGRIPQPSRRSILIETDIGRIRSLAVDPEGRFLLFQIHADATLQRIDLTQEPLGAPSTLLTTTQAPALLTCTTLEVTEIEGVPGRCFVLTQTKFGQTSEDAHYVVLRDVENDGVVDSTLNLDGDAWVASPFADYQMWKLLIASDDYVPVIDFDQ